jgi:murein DD-endopeptidase MepM/ murein hydrolase activator NlpD
MNASVLGGKKEQAIVLGAFPIVEPTLRWGFAIDTLEVLEALISPGDHLGGILHRLGLDYPSIDQLVKNAAGAFEVKELRPGKPYAILGKDLEGQGPDYLVYEPSAYSFVVFQLRDELRVVRVAREVDKVVEAAGGVIESSLWKAMTEAGLSHEITAKMEDALQWSVDFHHLRKNDTFKLVYDQDYIEGRPVGIGRVHVAYYKTLGKEYYAIYYDGGRHKGYYDQEGRPMKKGFLKAPVKYSRISSYYNLNRFHPILKRVRPHFGTDYAAPAGTEIYAVGDGVVAEATYTNGNGNYVRIRHDKTYETQYLHMQKFAKGIRPGVHVQQGQVIGYVGSTGLATGPHVCFRFWMNGKQVNHLNLSFPPPAPLPPEELPDFVVVRDSLLSLLDGVAFPTPNPL